MFKNLSIGHKIALAFGAIIALLVYNAVSGKKRVRS